MKWVELGVSAVADAATPMQEDVMMLKDTDFQLVLVGRNKLCKGSGTQFNRFCSIRSLAAR